MQNKNYYLKKFAFSTYGYVPNWGGTLPLKSNAQIATEESNKKFQDQQTYIKELDKWNKGVASGAVATKAQKDRLADAAKDPRVLSGQMTPDEVIEEKDRSFAGVEPYFDRITPEQAQEKIKEIQKWIEDGTIKGDQIEWAKKEIQNLQNLSKPLTREEQIQKDQAIKKHYGDTQAIAEAVRNGTATKEQKRDFEEAQTIETVNDPEKAKVLNDIANSAKPGEKVQPGQLSAAEAQMRADNLEIGREANDRRSAYEKDMAQYNSGLQQLNALRDQVRNTTDPEERKRLSQKVMIWDLAAQRRKKEIDEKYAVNTADMTASEREKVRQQQATRDQVAAERAAAGNGPQQYNQAAIDHMKRLGYSNKAIAKQLGSGVDAQKALWKTMDENTRKAVGWNFDQQPKQQTSQQPVQQPQQQNSNTVNTVTNFKPNNVATNIKNPMSDVAKNITQTPTEKTKEKPKDNIITKAVRGGFDKYTL